MNIAKNIAELRQLHGMTQAELAQRLSYSDKAVSKWERAESAPDVEVLVKIAELFSVSLDTLVSENDRIPLPQAPEVSPHTRRKRSIVTAMSIVLVWFVATVAFVTLEWIPSVKGTALAFLCAAPLSLIVWLVFNTLWFDRRRNCLIVSLLLWITLAAVFLSMLIFSTNLWLIFVIGIPAQLLILLWSGLGHGKTKSERKHSDGK